MRRVPLDERPAFAPGEPPLSLLLDYDGTISRRDVGDTLLAWFVDSPEVARLDAAYEAGQLGSRELMRWDMDVLPDDAARLRAAARTISLDAGLVGFVDLARAYGVPVEIVSDGLGFYVAAGLARLSLEDLPVATNENRLAGGGAGLSFPFGHPHCFVCGTCKRERVRAHQAAGRAVIFVGDGASDRYAAFHSDLVFAKDQLAELCRREGWPWRPWVDFASLTDWLLTALAEHELPTAPDELSAWRALHPSAARLALAAGGSGFICGPEVWGPDRSRPGPPPGPRPGPRLISRP